MGTHYHLLLKTPEPDLVSGMKWLPGTYTQRFNARHRQRGHWFQGRYRAVPVDVEEPEYFQTVSSYIHLNPARANGGRRVQSAVAGACQGGPAGQTARIVPRDGARGP
jgi:putative transposase